MSAFFRKYTIKVDIDFAGATEIFRDNLDDMSKKGYSLGGTVIYNSDHRGRFFSGEYKNGCFVVRQTDSGGDDFYYNILPKHFIGFSAKNGETEITVKSRNPFMLMIFIFLIAIAVLVFCIINLEVMCGAGAINLLYTLIPLLLSAAPILYSRKQLLDTEATIKYIYKKAKRD